MTKIKRKKRIEKIAEVDEDKIEKSGKTRLT